MEATLTNVVALGIILLLATSCQIASPAPKPSAECIESAVVMRYAGQVGCVWGIIDKVTLLQELKTTGVSFRSGPFSVLAMGVAISPDLAGKCVEVRGKILGAPGDGKNLSIVVDRSDQIRLCGK